MVKSKKTAYIVSALSVILALSMVGISFFLTRMLRGDVRESSSDVADYRSWSLSEQYSHLLIFPETVPAGSRDTAYYYRYESGYTRPMCQIYLSCYLDGETYAAEVERLAALAYESRSSGYQTVRYDETSFSCPAYVTIEGYDFCYEYALTDEGEKRIVYVYAMNTIREDIKFEEELLPDYFMEDFEEFSVTGLDRFTMYERYQDE